MIPPQSLPTPKGRILYVGEYLRYYLLYALLLPIAYLFNRSFLILHPDRVVPTFITPPYNHDIRTFDIPWMEIERIHG
jgi:hypothetical protein